MPVISTHPWGKLQWRNKYEIKSSAVRFRAARVVAPENAMLPARKRPPVAVWTGVQSALILAKWARMISVH